MTVMYLFNYLTYEQTAKNFISYVKYTYVSVVRVTKISKTNCNIVQNLSYKTVFRLLFISEV